MANRPSSYSPTLPPNFDHGRRDEPGNVHTRFPCQRVQPPRDPHQRTDQIHQICSSWRHIMEMVQAWRQGPTRSSRTSASGTQKKHAQVGSFYRSQHELVFCVEVWKAPSLSTTSRLGGLGRTNVWDYALPGTRRGELALHPTLKPVDFDRRGYQGLARKKGGLVLESFLRQRGAC